MMIMFFKIIRNLGKSEVTNPFKRYTGHPSYLGVDDLNFIDTTSKANPSLYLDEVWKRLADVRDIHASIATLSQAIASCHQVNSSKKHQQNAMKSLKDMQYWT